MLNHVPTHVCPPLGLETVRFRRSKSWKPAKDVIIFPCHSWVLFSASARVRSAKGVCFKYREASYGEMKHVQELNEQLTCRRHSTSKTGSVWFVYQWMSTSSSDISTVLSPMERYPEKRAYRAWSDRRTPFQSKWNKPMAVKILSEIQTRRRCVMKVARRGLSALTWPHSW